MYTRPWHGHRYKREPTKQPIIDSGGNMLQDTLSALGINVSLGVANIKISDALVQYASADITTPGATIRRGMRIKGAFDLFGLDSKVDFAFNTDGVRLNTSLDFSKVGGIVVKCLRFDSMPPLLPPGSAACAHPLGGAIVVV